MGLLIFFLFFTPALQMVSKDILKSWTDFWRDREYSREEGVGLGLLWLLVPLLPSLSWGSECVLAQVSLALEQRT